MARNRKTTDPAPTEPAGVQLDSNVTWGIVMLALGYTGAFADSSFALYLVGGAMLAWGIFRTMKPAQVHEKEKSGTSSRAAQKSDGIRETVESLVVAFILAFLFRSFEAEAFVIPTGSMAPTLLGRHKDVDCQQCGFHYTVGASSELNNGRLVGRLRTSRCPNCRFSNDILDLPPFPGDRIIVTKMYSDPQRFDVIVFKYPEEPHVNYIKRCVGKPLETITIMQGDLYRRLKEGDEWEILRKPSPDKQQRIQMIVYDDRNHAAALEAAGWPSRWAGVKPSSDPQAIGGWAEAAGGFDREGHTHRLTKATADMSWLRYRHVVASQRDWQAVLDGVRPQATPYLISDFCGYNMTEGYGSGADDHGIYWVGDLTVELTAEITDVSADGELVIELIEGVNTYRARIRPGSGRAVLTRTWEDTETELGAAEISLDGPGEYDLRFANVDNRLTLWIDGSVVDFGDGALIPPESQMPTDSDLCPVGVGAKGLALDVFDLVLYRDIYYRDEAYRNERFDSTDRRWLVDNWAEVYREADLQNKLSMPEEWYLTYTEGRSDRDADVGRMVTYELGENEYLMLGDNSPRSQDSRLFSQGARVARGDTFSRFAVPGDAIVGKAFFVYWPHGQPFLNEGKGYAFPLSYHVNMRGEAIKDYPNHRIPFYPNLKRMRRIR